jgi:xanthine dehydrogenase accessory factor
MSVVYGMNMAAPEVWSERSDDPVQMFALAMEGLRGGLRIALITLTDTVGVSAREPGAQMVVLEDGRYCGFVSGGCTEGAVAVEALRAIQAGADRILRLGQGSPFIDIVLPCGGGVILAIHVVREPDIFEHIASSFVHRQGFTLSYEPGRQRLDFEASLEGRTGWQGEVFVRRYRPQTRLVLCGRGIELEAAARLALASDLEVDCYCADDASHRAVSGLGGRSTRLATPSAIPPIPLDADSALVLLFHDLDWDAAVLKDALASPALYVGALGSRRTQACRRQRLDEEGLPAAAIDRVKGPVGLFGPSRNASSLAVSILADVMQARAMLR